jgi:phosphoribosylformylglycinamidine (FGAM) synthase-like amidotransferase family enzyme
MLANCANSKPTVMIRFTKPTSSALKKIRNKNALLRVENTETAFTKNYKKNQLIKIPIAHMDGNVKRWDLN